MYINHIQDGVFRAAHGWSGGKKTRLPKICHTYPITMKLGTVIRYLKKIQRLLNHMTHPLSSADISAFFTGNQPILLYQEIQICIPFRYLISNSSNFSWVFKDCLINMVTILMMSANMATPGLENKNKCIFKKIMTSYFLSMTSSTKFYHVIQIIM